MADPIQPCPKCAVPVQGILSAELEDVGQFYWFRCPHCATKWTKLKNQGVKKK